MADDARAADAQERSTAEFLVFEPRFESMQPVSNLVSRVAVQLGQEQGQFLLEGRKQKLDRAFAGLEQHIPDESIADDNARVPFIDVASFDVADEPRRPGAILVDRPG